MIEIDGNRVYVKGLFCCYASHSLPAPISGDCGVMFSHRHGRNLVNVAGEAWLGDNDGSLPNPDIVIGHVVGPDGLLPDAGAMEHIVNIIQVREDDGLTTRIKVC
jgi:hypothetical protein